jgi:1-hydroxy-2-isopentenylcarotenoid 3,4-desaturase
MGGRAVVVGAGFGGLAAASLLAHDGWDVTVVEKNATVGGRARLWKERGFSFDIGPSWYLMPQPFEDFFEACGVRRSDYYGLKRLDPSYKVFFEGSPPVTVGAGAEAARAVFDGLEPGGGARLDELLANVRYNYDVAMREFLYREYRSPLDFLNRRLMIEGLRLGVLQRLDSYVARYFKDPRARKILEYTMVFLGASPTNAPALYAIMAYVDFELGVWYPDGGMAGAAQGFARLAEKLGVRFELGADVTAIDVEGGRARGVRVEGRAMDADAVIVNGDYAHAELALLPDRWRSYPERYWRARTLGPSMLLAFVGIEGRLKGLEHHNLYFADDWDEHFDTIFGKPAWPSNPCYYANVPSLTDPAVAPPGCENLFVLVPLAAGLDDGDGPRERCMDSVLRHLERLTGQSIRDRALVRRLYSGRDFASDYHSYGGSALGPAHTLFQTAAFRPAMRSRKVSNLYYCGQYTHPGVGVPMVVIAARVVSRKVTEEQG